MSMLVADDDADGAKEERLSANGDWMILPLAIVDDLIEFSLDLMFCS